jgi:hypothetical protein
MKIEQKPTCCLEDAAVNLHRVQFLSTDIGVGTVGTEVAICKNTRQTLSTSLKSLFTCGLCV